MEKCIQTPEKRNIFRHITKAGMDFQDAMFDYMADFNNEKLTKDANRVNCW